MAMWLGVYIVVGLLILIWGVCKMFKKENKSYLTGLTSNQMRQVSEVKKTGGNYVRLCNYYRVLNDDNRYGRVVGIDGIVRHEGFKIVSK